MSRLPIRLRLTLAFTIVMAAVLAAMSFFVYARVDNALISSLDQSLRSQTVDVSRVDRGRLDLDAASGGGIAQVILPGGRVAASDPPGLPRLLGKETLQRVVAGGRILGSERLPGLSERWRVLAQPTTFRAESAALVVAKSLEPRDETLDHLLGELLVAGPLALLFAAVAGYGLAAAALRPVEAMRSRAEAISASTPGTTLPEPASRDEISRLAETLNEMLARLESAFAHERRFIADASHELRTPLALLKTELEVALRRRRSRDELEQALRSASDETDRLTQLAEDLLLIARSDAGGLPIRRERIPVSAVFDVVAERFSGPARAAGKPSRPCLRTDSCSMPTRCGSSRLSETSLTTRSSTEADGSCSPRDRVASWWSCTSRTRGPGSRRSSLPKPSAGSAARSTRAVAAEAGSDSRSWS
jgi:two-component system OmpR family sensor kinase